MHFDFTNIGSKTHWFQVTALDFCTFSNGTSCNPTNQPTCPVLSDSLLVSLTFSKDTDNLWSPRIEKGLSGCKYWRLGGGGSALPATNHDDLW